MRTGVKQKTGTALDGDALRNTSRYFMWAGLRTPDAHLLTFPCSSTVVQSRRRSVIGASYRCGGSAGIVLSIDSGTHRLSVSCLITRHTCMNNGANGMPGDGRTQADACRRASIVLVPVAGHGILTALQSGARVCWYLHQGFHSPRR